VTVVPFSFVFIEKGSCKDLAGGENRKRLALHLFVSALSLLLLYSLAVWLRLLSDMKFAAERLKLHVKCPLVFALKSLFWYDFAMRG